MRTRHPIFGRGRESNKVRVGFGIVDKSRTGLTSPTFNAVQYKTENGSRVKLVSIGQFANKTTLGPAGTPMQPTLRIARVIDSITGTGLGPEYSFFLESCWINIVPGTAAGKVFYSPHLRTSYDNKASVPCWLDWIVSYGKKFLVRRYTDWMNDEIVYKKNHGNIKHALYNSFAHSGRIAKFVRCCLGSAFDTELFTDVLIDPPSWALSYFIQVDDALNYWFIKVTQAGMWRAGINFRTQGQTLHTLMKGSLNQGERIDQFSEAHKELRHAEAYLFGTAHSLTSFVQIGAFDIIGTSVGYGWSADYNGDYAAMVTLAWEPGAVKEFLGIRSRLYIINNTTSPAAIDIDEETLNTPENSLLTGYTPDPFSLTGRMAAWQPKHFTEEYDAELDTNMMIHAYYNEDDTLCKWRYQQDKVVNFPAAGPFIAWINTLPTSCAVGSVHEGMENGGYKRHCGFYSENLPDGDVDYRRDMYALAAGGEYFKASWSISSNGRSGKADARDYGCLQHLTLYDCGGGWVDPGSAPGNFDVTGSGMRADYVRELEDEGSRLHYSTFMFNYFNPASFTVIDLHHRSFDTSTYREYSYEGMGAWYNSGFGNGVSGFPYPAEPPRCNSTASTDCQQKKPAWSPFPYVFSCPAYLSENFNQNLCCQFHLNEGATSEVFVTHIMATEKEVIEIYELDAGSWADANSYANIHAPAYTYPYWDQKIYCRTGLDNYIVSGEITNTLDQDSVTDMTVQDEYLGSLTMPIGRA